MLRRDDHDHDQVVDGGQHETERPQRTREMSTHSGEYGQRLGTTGSSAFPDWQQAGARPGMQRQVEVRKVRPERVSRLFVRIRRAGGYLP
jgi:hypothetical protein